MGPKRVVRWDPTNHFAQGRTRYLQDDGMLSKLSLLIPCGLTILSDRHRSFWSNRTGSEKEAPDSAQAGLFGVRDGSMSRFDLCLPQTPSRSQSAGNSLR